MLKRILSYCLVAIVIIIAISPILSDIIRLVYNIKDYSYEQVIDVICDQRMKDAIINSTLVVISSSVLAVSWAMASAWFLLNRLNKTTFTLLLIPIILPPIVSSYSFAIIANLLNIRLSIWVMIFGHAFLGFPISVFVIRHGLSILDQEQIMAARNLGINWIYIQKNIVLPHLKRWVALAIIAVMLISWGDFYYSWFLGGLNQTISTAIFSSVNTSITEQTLILGITGGLVGITLIVLALHLSTNAKALE